jgi:hypothetical protein
MKKLGRAFNHLEDLVFFYGSDGVKEAIQHIQEICNDSSSVRMKWDGGLQIYWGRETVNGPLIMTGHNGWARGSKSTSPEELYDFIVNQSGKDRINVSDQRKEHAIKFGKLFPLLDAATPKDFVGFVYADLLYWNKPPLANNEYNFYPNHTGYTVNKDTALGKRIENSNILLAGHAYFNAFGLKDDQQLPLDNFDIFNITDEVIILNPYYSKVDIQYRLTEDTIDKINSLCDHLDKFLKPITGVSEFREYIYKYFNAKMKYDLLVSFYGWLSNGQFRISGFQLSKIMSRIHSNYEAYNDTFRLIYTIRDIKNQIIEELENHDCDVKAYNPEGWVRYSDDNKQFGHIKLVPRHKWTP